MNSISGSKHSISGSKPRFATIKLVVNHGHVNIAVVLSGSINSRTIQNNHVGFADSMEQFMIRFVWDDKKAAANLRKHGVSFQRATEVFKDPLRETRFNRLENGEERYQTIGSISFHHKLLLVIHTQSENGIEIIKIISARRLNKKERRVYEHG